MPVPTAGTLITTNQASVTVQDYKGAEISTVVKSHGATISTADAKTLADAIGNASNACPIKWNGSNSAQAAVSDRKYFDEAEAAAGQVMVVVLVHDTDPRLNQEVLIPGYDASMLLADGRTPDVADARLLAVATAALAIANDTGNPLDPAIYSSWRAFTSTRKARKQKNVAENLPAIREPGLLELPPDAPGV